MNYIYDIILNFNDNLYESYEWDISDEIIHIKKIPIFKVNKKDYFNIKNNIVLFEKEFLIKIINQNQLYKSNKLKQFDYIFLLAFEEEVIGIKLNSRGKIIQKSHLLIDEERCILKNLKRFDLTKINYKIIKKDDRNPYLTRKEKKDIQTIIKEITRLYKNNEESKLSYLYLECFNIHEKNIDKIFSVLKKELLSKPEIFNKAMDFFKLLKQK